MIYRGLVLRTHKIMRFSSDVFNNSYIFQNFSKNFPDLVIFFPFQAKIIFKCVYTALKIANLFGEIISLKRYALLEDY
jgi:hypothetical protein